MIKLITALLLCAASWARPDLITVTPEMFGAVGNGKADDTQAVQAAIDSAIKVRGRVYIGKKYRTTSTLIAAEWKGTDYGIFSFQLIGDGNYWDVGTSSKILMDFTDGPALAIQRGKGIVISGVSFEGKWKGPGRIQTIPKYADYGDTTFRDTRFSPSCLIAIDPFGPKVPADGGYPRLTSWYRGGKSGSTGIQIEHCTLQGAPIGLITSPSGQTVNGENIDLTYIRLGDCRIGVVGCNSQERNNTITHLGAWSDTHTIIHSGNYGAKEAGQWTGRDWNVAGEVLRLVDRNSQGYYPLFLSDIKAERIITIGYWQTALTDNMSNSTIHLRPIKEVGYIDNNLYGNGVAFNNVVFRYYDGTNYPPVVKGNFYFNSYCSVCPKPLVVGQTVDDRFITPSTYENVDISQSIATNAVTDVKSGVMVAFVNPGTMKIEGYGISMGAKKEQYLTPSLTTKSFRVSTYKQ